MESQPPKEAVVDLDIDASPEEVWHALTSDEGWVEWMGEESTIGTGVGEELYAVDPVTGQPKRGEIDEFDKAQRLGYRWWPEQDPRDASQVSITLTPCESGTRVTVIETMPGVALCGGSSPKPPCSSTAASWCWRVAMISLVAQSVRVGGLARA